MITTILGTKDTMTQAWTRSGQRVAVTRVKVGPLVVTYRRKQETDGYNALQLGFGRHKTKNIAKPQIGHLRGAVKNNKAPRFLREVPVLPSDVAAVGDTIQPQDIISPGDVVRVAGVSKGKGFAGGVKRWGFHGGPRTHGQSDRERAPGSIGQGTTPGRVYKGKHMAGRMGGRRTTVRNLTVLTVNEDELLLSGAVPGPRGSLLEIEKIGENKKFEGLMNADNQAPLPGQVDSVLPTEAGGQPTPEAEKSADKQPPPILEGEPV